MHTTERKTHASWQNRTRHLSAHPTTEARATLSATIRGSRHQADAVSDDPRLAILLSAMRSCRVDPARHSPSCKSSNFMSQHAEDRVLLPLLMFVTGGRPGVFVELGALDGLTFSNTYALETCHGWRGVLIEADPANFEKLRMSGRAATAIHAAVCDGATGTFPISHGYGAAGGATSGNLAGMSLRHRQQFRMRDSARVTLTPCKPLNVLMKAAVYDEATFLSLDVEGAELHVLQNANVSAFRVILIEMDGEDRQKEDAVEALLWNAGFWLAYDLILGPEREGGRSKVFVDRSLKKRVPHLDVKACDSRAQSEFKPPHLPAFKYPTPCIESYAHPSGACLNETQEVIGPKCSGTIGRPCLAHRMSS